MKTKHPLVNIIVLKEGQKNDNFSVALAAWIIIIIYSAH